jgi:hypothetical protein
VAGLFIEFVPSVPGAAAPDPFAGGAMTVTATCATCGGGSVEATVQPYPSLAPAELWHPDATAAYTARIVLPKPGAWLIEPFARTVHVRDLDAFEPPLVHVYNWSDPFEPGCGRAEVAELVNGFVAAYNAGDSARLARLVQEPINFSIAGGAGSVVATSREELLSRAPARRAMGDTLTVTRIYVASAKGSPSMAIYGTRTAADLPAGGQQWAAKAAMWCTQQQFIHLNIGVF